jgi:hypothetical protein
VIELYTRNGTGRAYRGEQLCRGARFRLITETECVVSETGIRRYAGSPNDRKADAILGDAPVKSNEPLRGLAIGRCKIRLNRRENNPIRECRTFYCKWLHQSCEFHKKLLVYCLISIVTVGQHPGVLKTLAIITHRFMNAKKISGKRIFALFNDTWRKNLLPNNYSSLSAQAPF